MSAPRTVQEARAIPQEKSNLLTTQSRDNFEPTLDARNNWTSTAAGTPSHGDVRGDRLPAPDSNAWASEQPSEGRQVSWRFGWSSPSVVGLPPEFHQPSNYYLADRGYPATKADDGHVAAQDEQSAADPVYLTIPTLGDNVSGASKVQFVTDAMRGPGSTSLTPWSATGGEGLTFHYTAIDLGGNRVPFDVFVPTRDNFEPTLDARNNWTSTAAGAPSHGDARGDRLPTPDSNAWASEQPSEGRQVSWRFGWSAASVGLTPAPYYLADRGYPATTLVTDHVAAQPAQSAADPVYLAIPTL
jgi:hypothetical protein